MKASNNTEWLNLGQAAEILGVHPSTLRTWADQGEVQTHRTPGRHRRFRREDIETFAAARRDARVTTGHMVIQNALGRTRMQMAEGRLQGEAWYSRLDDAQKQAFRETGRSLLALLLRYLSDEADEALQDSKAIGRTHERLGREAGLTLAEKISVFLYFRDFLYDSVIDVYQASGQRAAREWAQMHRRIASLTNTVLLALVEAHEAGEAP